MIMMKRIVVILLFLVFLLGETSVSAFADEVLPSPQEEALLALINQARENPLAVAASLGMDPEKILEDLPELEKILQEGLSPLTFNGNLAEAARVHTEDMFAQGYYSHLSPDGRDYDERIREIGYPAVVSGESLGMILFANFINPEDAVRLIFEYMFQDELDPSRTEKRNILDPCLKEAGISVQSGALGLGGARWNVYLATCDFGAVLSCQEAQLLQLINQARENPLQMAASLGMDPEQVLADFPEWHDLLTQGLPPLSFNTGLAEAARAHAADMLENGYYSHDSLDGRTLEDRIREAGYDPLDAGETLWRACLCHDDVLLADLLENNNSEQIEILLQNIFRNIFTRSLWPSNTEEKNIVNASLKEVGIGLAFGISPELGGICGDRVLLLVMDFGSSSETNNHDAR
jgi:uncharacterized protein YkwD